MEEQVEPQPELKPEPTQQDLANKQRQTDIALARAEAAALTQTNVLDPVVYKQLKDMASDFVSSGVLPATLDKPEKVVIVLQAGYEMGMKPMESIQSLYIINGAVNVWGKALVRRLREHGWSLNYEDQPDSVTATIAKGEETYTETYTFDEANQSGYTKDSRGQVKIGWKEGINRKLKLRYGVLSLLVKTYVPEVLGAAADVAEIAQDYPIEVTQAVDKKAEMMAALERHKAEEGEVIDTSAKPEAVTPEAA